jgi:hypothetical protein
MLDNTTKQLQKVFDSIMNIEDPLVGTIVMGNFKTSLNTIQQVQENNDSISEGVDISDQINQVCEILGFDLREMVTHIMSQANPVIESDKEVDKDTLDFITSDLDDYERFLAQAKAKKELDFLKGVL